MVGVLTGAGESLSTHMCRKMVSKEGEFLNECVYNIDLCTHRYHTGHDNDNDKFKKSPTRYLGTHHF